MDITDKRDVSNAFNRHFGDVGPDLDRSIKSK